MFLKEIPQYFFLVHRAYTDGIWFKVLIIFIYLYKLDIQFYEIVGSKKCSMAFKIVGSKNVL